MPAAARLTTHALAVRRGAAGALIPLRNLPWHGSGVAQQQIPMRLTQGKRPEHQIRKAYPIKELIEECWDTDPHRRPDFPEVVQRLRKFLDQARSGKLPPERQSTSREIEEGDEEEEDEEIGGAE